MRGNGFLGTLFKQVGFYRNSFYFFLIIGVIALVVFNSPLKAEEAVNHAENTNQAFDIDIQMRSDGTFYVDNSKVSVETVAGDETYRFRYQILNHPKEIISSLIIGLHLPKPLPEASISHRFISNGGASLSESYQQDQQTIVYHATDIGNEAQLTLEVEVPKNYVSTSALSNIAQKLQALPPIVWTSFSIALPALTFLLLLLVAISRARAIPESSLKEVSDPPSRLSPALVGILMHGRLTSREVAATLIDLARRGHLLIHQFTMTDFRFARRSSHDHLEDFESVLLDQVFGPLSDRTSSEEISFSLAQELFSKKISQAFVLAYKKINDLGYFYTNPLTLHRRYQTAGILLFMLGISGFTLNLLVFSNLRFFLLFWIGMMISAVLIHQFSKGLPSRTIFGDRELARWLAFGKNLSGKGQVDYSAMTQDKYMAYLPYAIVMNSEVEWTRRFYELPFNQPAWYVASRITTIDEFANKIFPLFGYLSHSLAISAQPASR